MKTNVAHICPTYLELSETFVYRYLISFKKVQPIVFSEQIKNLKRFPLPENPILYSYKRFTLRWIFNLYGKHILSEKDYHRKWIFKKRNVKLIHAHYGPTGYNSLEWKEVLGVKLITTFYGFDMSILPKNEEWRSKYSKLFREGDLFLVEGSCMKNELIKIGCPESKILIQHIAIDTNQFYYTERKPKPDGCIILLFCGRFTEKKGLVYALMAFNLVSKGHGNIRFRIIGDGELRREIEIYIADNNLGEKVDLLGMQPHSVVAEEMTKADILIQPSVTAADGDTEGGAPTILLEAQASGVPILSTYHADIPEIVVPGKSALLSEERNWQQLADNLLIIVNNQETWSRMGMIGREHVINDYDIKKEVVKLEEIYQNIIE